MNDILIIGGGIVGLATAMKLQELYPGKKILLLEKENKLSRHQTGSNSGVIHSGLYYKPGSYKALNCINGYNQLIKFCDENDVRFEVCGKVVVATEEQELPYLKTLNERGTANGLKGILELNHEELKEYEPHVRGVAGLFVPQTGIIDYSEVSLKYADLFRKSGGEIRLNSKVTGIFTERNSIVVETERNSYHTKYLVNCAGLYSDKITEMGVGTRDFRIIPFRGEYYVIKKEKQNLVNNLIYPVPNPNFPFLGVHFTRMINGGIEAGPNAVLAFKKEGYTKKDIHLGEFVNTLSWPGFQKVAMKYWRTGAGEMYRSFSKTAFTKALQNLIPEIQENDLISGGSGVRAQACDRNGNLLDDFHFVETERQLHVCNAPSPAATSSLAIADEIISRVKKRN